MWGWNHGAPPAAVSSHGCCCCTLNSTLPAATCRNSEIYNHEQVKQQYLKGVKIVKNSKSDSAIIGHLYEVRGAFPHACPPSLSCLLHSTHAQLIDTVS
jgi:hypothetical protein